MTRAVLYRSPDGALTGFSVKGHAGYSVAGSDIVCAAVSILTTTCINALERVTGLSPIVRGGENAPLLEADLPGDMTEDQHHDAQVLMMGLHQGLSDLSEAYPRYFKLSIQERRETP